MLSEHVTVMLSADQAKWVRRVSPSCDGRRHQGESISAVSGRAVDAYFDDAFAMRRDAAKAILAMNLPVDDWEVMKAEIEASRYPELPGWKP